MTRVSKDELFMLVNLALEAVEPSSLEETKRYLELMKQTLAMLQQPCALLPGEAEVMEQDVLILKNRLQRLLLSVETPE